MFKDYGPLFRQLKSKKWLLTANAIKLNEGTGQLNVFSVGDGNSVLAVVIQSTTDTVSFTLSLPAQAVKPEMMAEALYPGGHKGPVDWQRPTPTVVTCRAAVQRSVVLVRLSSSSL